MVRQTTKVIILEIFGVISLVLMAAIGVLAFMLASGPVELGMFRDDVERAITRARDGRPVTLERLTLQWSPGERRLFVVGDGLSLKDASNLEAGYAERAELTLDAGAIFLGDIELIRAKLEGGWINVQNTGPNQWSIGGEPLPPIRAGQLPQSPAEWLERINIVLGDVLLALDELDDQLTLESLTFEDTDLRFLGPDNTEVATIEAAAGEISRPDGDLSVQLAGDGQGVGLPEVFGISFDTFDNFQTLTANVDVGILPFNDLASLLGVTPLSQGDLSLGTSFSAEVGRSDGLHQVGLVVARESGTLTVPNVEETISGLNAALTYRPDDDSISIDRLDISSDRISGIFTGELQNVLAVNALRRLELDADELNLDFSPVFGVPWTFTRLEFGADISDDFTIAVIDAFRAEIGEATVQASGEIDLSVETELGQLPFEMQIAAEVIGEFDKDKVLQFWPLRLGSGARNYVIERLFSGTVTEASAILNLKPDSMAEGYLRDEDLAVTFAFKEGELQFLSDMPTVKNAVGTGRVGGNSLGITVLSATYDDWDIGSGTVDFPAFNPRGQTFTVTAEGAGPAVSILRQLSASRLRLQEQTGFDPERLGGQATATVQLTRPALNDVPIEDHDLKVIGTIQGASLQNAVGELALSNGSVDVDLTLDRMILTGFGDLGVTPVQFTWRDGFDDDGTPADLSATAVLTPDVLNVFGLVGRAFLTGEVPVDMQGEVGTGGLQTGTFAFDLTNARIDLNEIDWVKPVGDTARATLRYTGDLREQAAALRFTSDTGRLDGDLRLANDGRLRQLDLRELFIEDSMNVSGQVRRVDGGGLDVRLSGAYLDISGLVGGLGKLGSADESANIDLGFSANVDRLRLRRGLDLFNAGLSFELNETVGLERLSADGATEDGGTTSLRLQSSGAQNPMAVVLEASDAGYLAEAFLDLDFIQGGALDLTGTLATDSEPAKLNAQIRNARLRNAPFFTQILSLASLRGLTDTLSGEGVLFSEIDVPLTIGGGRYVIQGGRASGPALGLTVNGWVGTDGQGIELDGVLVPSFGVNSMLGGVPIIGDLIVGREGEGIFSITYSVRGTLEKAQVAVNPLSAVTPGILRRIFENPSDTSIPDAIPVDPNLQPPTEKLPDLPEEEVLAPTPGSDG